MEIPKISMQSQRAQIEIRQTKEKQEIKQATVELSIEQPHAKLSIQSTPGKLQIDQTQAWEDMNLMHIFKRNAKFSNDGKSDLLEGIAKKAQQGTALMKLENEGNPLVNQAITNSQKELKSLGITFMPSHFSVKTNYEPAQIHIDVQTNKPVVSANIQKAEHHYERGSVEINMKQYQQLKIDVVY